MRTMTKPIVIFSIGMLFLLIGIFPVIADETSQFQTGLNFWAYPVQPASGYSAYDLIQDLNSSASVNGLQRYNAQTGEFESCIIHDSSAAGVDFPIIEVDGYVVSVGPTPFQYIFSGISTCPDTLLNFGFNLAGFPCAPVGYSAYALLNDLGFSNITRLKTLDAATGHILEATWSGSTPVGDDFSISAGRACIAEMFNNTIWVAPETNQPPQELTAYSGNSQIILTWEEPYGPPDGYKIYRSGSSGGSYTVVSGGDLITALEWPDTGLTNNTPYFYVATAVYPGSAESVFSVEATATPTTSSSTTISSDIAADTTWTMDGSPYIVTNSIQIPLGVTLTIEPGVAVRFDSGHLEVRGKLETHGTEIHPVTFSSNSATPALGDWIGIRFIGSEADGSLLEYCRIEHATIGVYCEDASPEISHCEIVGEHVNVSNYFYGIKLLRSNAHIHDCDISHFENDYYNRGWGIYMRESSPLIENNNILENEYGIHMYYGGTPQILNNTIQDFRMSGIYCDGEYKSTNAPFPVINNNVIQTIYDSSDTWNLHVRRYAGSGTIDPSLVIDARNNYWGTTKPEEIAAAIHQWPRYTIADPFVDFRGFLDAPRGGVIPGHFIHAGRLPADELNWTAASGPYIVLGSTFIEADQILNITEGTEVRFIGGQDGASTYPLVWSASLRVNGKLNALGTSGNEILFTSNESTPVQGDWNAIYFNAGADSSSIISHSRIEYAFNGIWCTGSSPTISNNEIIGVVGDHFRDMFFGLRLESNCNSQVTNNVIRGFHNTYYYSYYGRAISIYNASPTVSGNILEENSIGIWIDTYNPTEADRPVAPSITGNSIINSYYRSMSIDGDGNDIENPAPVITGNNIFSDYSSTDSFYTNNFGSGNTNVIDATGNWWSTDDPEEIGTLIRDWNDITSAPVVDYRGWLDAAGGTPATGTQIYAGRLSGSDLTWTAANSPYLILGRIEVASGDTLTIQAGTEVIFVNGATGLNDRGINVSGTLTAIGTFAEPIFFRSNRPDATLGDWTGIRFIGSGADGSLLEYCQIEHAVTGIYAEDASPEISYCTIVGEEKTASANYFGIYLLRSNAHIHHCNISDFVNNSSNWTRAIYMRESSPLIEYNDILNNEYGIEMFYGGTPQILNNTIQDFRKSGIYCNGDYQVTNAPFPVINNNIIQTIYNSSDTWNLHVRRYASSTYIINPSLIIDARNNYWGTTKPEEIAASIHQWPRYTPADPFVDFRNFLDAPGGGVVPGHYIHTGRLPADELNWTAASGPYIVLGSTFIEADQILNIAEGTEVRFIGGQDGASTSPLVWSASLRVDGKLNALGTSGNEILFTSNESTPVQGDWDAIYFNAGADSSSIISHSRIEYAFNGIWCTGSSPTISNNKIIGVVGDHFRDMFFGLRLESNCNSQVTNNVISGFHNTYYYSYYGRAISIYNASPTVSGNLLEENSIGIWIDTYNPTEAERPVAPSITGNSIINSYYRSMSIDGDGNDIENPAPVITGNDFFSDYISTDSFYTNNFGSGNTNVIDATGNWWSTDDPEEIGTLIRDWNDITSAPVVDYRGWLDAAGGTPAAGTQIYAGLLSGSDLTWTVANSPYLILGRIEVASGDTLTIQAGTEVNFVNGTTGLNDRGINVSGTLTTIGTFADPIVFRSNRPDATLGDWTGIRFIGAGADGSLLKYCRIEHAVTGIYIEDASPEISYCTIVGEEKTASANYYGIYMLRSNAHIHHCNISHFVNNSSYWTRAIYMRESSPLIEYNDILNNEYGIEMYYGGTPQILNNTIEDFRKSGIYCNGEYQVTNAPFPVINNNIIQTTYDSTDTWNLHVRRYASSTPTIDPSLVIDARNNYWGTTKPEEIAAAIHQWPQYTPADPFVDFRNFLDSPGGSVVPGHYIHGGRLPADELNWTAASGPYIVLGSTFIEADQILNITEGTEVRFIGGQAESEYPLVWAASLRVNGKLNAQGTSTNQILFTSNESTPVQGDWDAIYFNAGADNSSIISHSRIEYGYNGIWCTSSSPTISYNEIVGVVGEYYRDKFFGLRLESDCNSQVTNNVISGFHNTYYYGHYGRAIYIFNASPTVSGNMLDENSIGIWIDTYNPTEAERPVAPSITGNSIINSRYRSVHINGDDNDTENPHPVITGNNIFSSYVTSNSFYTEYFGSTSTDIINVTDNWWGTNDSGTIDTIVYERADYYTAANVNYSGHRSTDIGSFIIYGLTLSDDYFSPDGDGEQDTVTITGAGIDVTSWTVTVRNESGATVDTYTGSLPWSWDGNSQPEGVYTIVVTGTDGATSLTRTFTTRIDKTMATATIDSPADGSTQSGIFDVLCSVNDDNLFSYTLELGAGTSPTSWTWLNGDNDSGNDRHDGAAPVTDLILYNWISNETEDDIIPSSNGFIFNNGDYTLRLTATDRAGNTTVTTSSITLDNLFITDVSRDNSLINPDQSETADIHFSINYNADVSVKIYPEWLGEAGGLVREINQSLTAGARTISWDGKNGAGQIVQDEAYIYVIEAISSGRTDKYLPMDGHVDGSGTDSTSGNLIATDYNVFTNDFWKIDYYVNGPSGRVCMEVTPSGEATFRVVDMEPHEAEEIITLLWDGRRPNGTLVEQSVGIYFPPPTTLRSNYILVNPTPVEPVLKGIAPHVEVKADPYLVNFCYGEFTHLLYNLDRAAAVTVTILPPGITDPQAPEAIVILSSELQIAGDHTVSWDAIDELDPKNILMSEEGVYTFVIEATSGQTTTWRGVLNLFH